MIPEWKSFRNKFCSRVKFVLHTNDKINQPIPRRSLSRQIRYACATFPRLNGLQFSIRKKVHFHNIVMKREFYSEQKSGMTWREGNVVSVLLFGKQIQRNMQKWNEMVPEWKYFRHHVTVAPTMMALLYDVTWRHVASEKWFSYNLRRIHIFLLVVLLCLYLNFSSWREFHLLLRCFLLDIVKVQCWRALYLSVNTSCFWKK